MNALLDKPVFAYTNNDTVNSDNNLKLAEQKHRQSQLQEDLTKAIASDQLRVYYQPVINLETNEIFAAEAFIRWEHPKFGTLLPRDFLLISEETDFIFNIDDWVLNRVCHNYSEWLREGLPPIKIAVNHSSNYFMQPDFVDHIQSHTKKCGLEPDFLIIEILERTPVYNFNAMRNNIDKLQRLGIQVALDDFGTGFSSLEYLSKMNVDILKIDRQFVQPIPFSSTNAIIIESILNMAQKLGIQVVAEGIENSQQLDFLKSKNCQAGQGYYFSKPMPSQDYKNMLKERTGSMEQKSTGSLRQENIKSLEQRNTGSLKQENTKSLEQENTGNLHQENTKSLEQRNTGSMDKSDSSTGDSREMRRYKRHRFPLHLEASMSILKHRGKNVRYGNTSVLIQDIGAGGLCFYTTMRMPVRSGLLVQFVTTILGEQYVFRGTLVWTREVMQDLFKYGVQFVPDDDNKSSIDALIPQLEAKVTIDVENGDFVQQPPYDYFQTL